MKMSINLNDHNLMAKALYGLDAFLGMLAVGGAALYGATFATGPVLPAFLSVFIPCTIVWVLFCFCAYKALWSDNIILKIIFWLHVVSNVFVFPLGTAVAAASIWLWRELGA